MPEFYVSRYYPIHFTKKLIYLAPSQSAVACEAYPGFEGKLGRELLGMWPTLQDQGYEAVDPPVPKGSEWIKVSRYYPVDDRDRLIYMDSYTTPAHCEAHPNCTGWLGFELRANWLKFKKAGFTTVAKTAPENRGGAGRGQGALPQNLGPTCKVPVSDAIHQAYTEMVQSGSMRSLVSALLDRVAAAPASLEPHLYQPSSGGKKQLVIDRGDCDRLNVLIQHFKPTTPHSITRASLLASIMACVKSPKKKTRRKPDT